MKESIFPSKVHRAYRMDKLIKFSRNERDESSFVRPPSLLQKFKGKKRLEVLWPLTVGRTEMRVKKAYPLDSTSPQVLSE